MSNRKTYTEKELERAFAFYAFASSSQQPFNQQDLDNQFFNFKEMLENEKIQKRKEREEKRIMGLPSVEERHYKKIINENKDFLADIPFIKK